MRPLRFKALKKRSRLRPSVLFGPCANFERFERSAAFKPEGKRIKKKGQKPPGFPLHFDLLGLYGVYCMKRRRFSSRLFLLVSVLSLLVTHIEGQTNAIIIPAEAEEMFGDSFADPFFFSSYVEQIYGQSEFADAPGDVLNITSIAFRVDESSRRALDAEKPEIMLWMNIFRGAMEEVVEKKTGVQNPVSVVFREQNVHLLGRTGLVEAFDVSFALETPFVYDRRLGQLVVTILSNGQYTGTGTSMDAHGIYGNGGISFERGAYIYIEPFGVRRVVARLMDSKISYHTKGATIETIEVTQGSVFITFTVIGIDGTTEVEGAPFVNGPYTVEPNAQYTTTPEGKTRAMIPVSTDDRFFRVRLE